ncbi:MAG: hypothetical protein ACOQNY_00675 [Mycoplasmoidaceae bacterium]
MKNKIKICLSPVIVSAILTPIVCAVSCDSPNWVEPIVMHDINDEWQDPTDYNPFEDEDWWSNDKVMTEYVNHMSEHPDHFIEDMLWGVSKRYSIWHDMYKQDEDKYLLKIEKCQFGFSEPKFGETYVWVRGVGDTRCHTVSFKEEVEVDYITPDTNAKSIIKQKIHIHIEYNDIILNIIPPHHVVDEPTSIEPITDIGWSIGVLNELSEAEALWSYTYNIKPWSITYGCSNQIVEEMLDDEGNVVSELHNTKYYSGLVNNYSGLYDLYVAQKSVGPDDSANDRLKREIIVTILNLECQSYLLSETKNLIDIILVEHLWGNATSQTLTSNIMTFKLIPAAKREDIEITSIILGQNFKGVENGASEPIIMTASQTQKLNPLGNNEYSMVVTFSKNFEQTRETLWHSFNLTSPYLNIKINYTISGEKQDPINVPVNLHYNTVDIKQAPDPV